MSNCGKLGNGKVGNGKLGNGKMGNGKLGNRKIRQPFLVGSVKSATVKWAVEVWSRFLIQQCWLNAIVSYLRYCRN